MGDDNIIEFPGTPEDKQQRELQEQAKYFVANYPTLGWWLTMPGGQKFLADHGTTIEAFRALVEGYVQEHEKQQGELKKREDDRQAKERKRQIEEIRRQAAERKAEEDRQRKLKDEVYRLFQKLMKLPSDAEQQTELATFAHHKGINAEKLRGEFEKHKKVAEEAVPADHTHNPDLRPVAPWPEAVDGVKLLEQILELEHRYLVFKHEAYGRASALWGVMTWFHHIGTVSPFLCAWSADPDSGKTTLIIFVSGISQRRYYITAPSEAGLRHDIHRWEPSVFIEEGDVLFDKESNALYRPVVASFNKGSVVPRADKKYVAFCPKAFAMKRMAVTLPEAFASRCIFIHMWPKRPGEVVQDLDPHTMVNDPDFLEIRQKIVRWKADNLSAIVRAYGHEKVAMPLEFNNRLQSKWKLLFVLADQIGGAWPKLIRDDAIALEGIKKAESQGKQLLEAMYVAFETRLKDRWQLSKLVASDKKLTSDPIGKGRDWIETYELTKILVSDPESNFHDWRKITRRTLAYLLDHSYQIKSRAIHPTKTESVTVQAYVLDDHMHEVFERSLQRSLRAEHAAYLARPKYRIKRRV